MVGMATGGRIFPRRGRSDESGDFRIGGVVREIGIAAGMAAVAMLAVRAGLVPLPLPTGSPLFWPTAGLAVAGLVIGGVRFLPAAFLGSFAGFVAAGVAAIPAAGLAGSDALAAFAAALLIRRSGFNPVMDRQRDAAWFLGAGALFYPALAGAGAVTVFDSAGLLPAGGFAPQWTAMAAGRSTGVLLIAPVVVVFLARRSAIATRPPRREIAAVLVTAALAAVLPGTAPVALRPLLAVLALLPLAFWGAVRFGPAGAAVANLLFAALFFLRQFDGGGEWSRVGPGSAEAMVLAVLCVSSAAALMVGAATAGREGALRAVRESEQRYRAFITQSTDAVWRVELTPSLPVGLPELRQAEQVLTRGTVEECNEAFARLCGAAASREILGRPLGAVLDRRAPGVIDFALELARSGYRLSDAEFRMATPGGSDFTVSCTVSGVFEGGSLVRLWGVLRDITANREAEERLRESRSLVQGIAEATPDLLHVFDLLERRVLYTNRAIGGVLGYPGGDRGDEAGERYIHPEDAPRVRGIADRLRSARDGEFLETEYRMKHHNGEWRWFLRRDTLFTRTADGLPALSLGIAQDITDRKKAEDAIRRSNEELERRVALRTAELEASNRELEAFSYSISHDLRAPLRAIDGYAHMLLEDHLERLDANGQRHLHMISRNSRRMGQLVDDLLAFSRLSRKPMEKEDVDMEALVRSVLADLSPAGGGSGTTVTVRPLPPATGDPAMLRQVWANLLSNALKFSSRTPHPRIEVSGRVEGGGTTYAVADNGIGFDMQYAHKLFGVFERLHPMDEFEGTGVGLALVQRIVLRHGGTVGAEGAVQRGAVFTFSLPRG